jgi:hypothetical protein
VVKLGGRSVAYVGNPSEIRTNPDQLMVAAVAGRERLAQFPDAPTFRELGIDGLEDEIMWRGFALRKGVPPTAKDWYEQLFRQVSADEGWRAFYEKDGIDVGFRDSQTFTATVMRDHQDFTNYLGQLGILRRDVPAPLSRFVSGWYPLPVLVILCLAGWYVVGWYVVRSLGGVAARQDVGEAVIPLVLLLIGGLLFLATLVFPKSDEVGAAAIPRLWLVALFPLCLVLGVQAWGALRSATEPGLKGGAGQPLGGEPIAGTRSPASVAPFCLLLLAYLPVMAGLGYFIATFLFLITAMFLLGERSPVRIVGVTLGWLLFSYLVFVRLLFVPLPTGLLWERLL